MASFDYLASLEWIRAAENLCMIGPAGTGKSHLLLALGSAAVDADHRVRYYSAAAWSMPSTAASPTTASARSLTHCCVMS